MCVFHECLNWEAIYKVFWASVEFFFLFTQGCNYFDVLCLFCFQIISKWMVKKTPAHFKNQRQLTWWGSSCVSDLSRGTDLCWAPSAGARQPSDRWNGTSAFPGNMALAACLTNSVLVEPLQRVQTVHQLKRTEGHTQQLSSMCAGSACDGTVSSRKIKCKRRQLWKIYSRANKINSG